MSHRSRRLLRYVTGFTWGAVGLALAVWFVGMGCATMWSQHKTERWMEDTSAGLRNLNDYTNKFDFGHVGDEVAGGESLTVTAPEN